MHAELKIGFLLFPYMTALDWAGPAQALSYTHGHTLHFVARTMAPLRTDAGYDVLPSHTFDDCPPLDIVCVPGGPGQQALMADKEVLQWLRTQGKQAQWVTSVCTGSLLLGAAGLLQGYRAASHWNYRKHLALFGVERDAGRVVKDRNRFTGGGITAGIDFALSLVAEIHGPQEAKEIQLLMEYAPEPPFECGRPEHATADTVAHVEQRLARDVEKVMTALASSSQTA